MQSVEHLVEQAHIVQESREELRWRLVFETYQEDFNLTDSQLKDNTLLDIGTGDGAFVHYVQQVLQNKNAYGIDFNQDIVPRDYPYLNVGNLISLPYTNNLFDTVVSRNVLHGLFLSKDVATIQKALSELLRVTKDGGLITYAIKDPERIKQAIQKDIHDEETVEHLIQKLGQNIAREAEYLAYIQSLGHKVSVTFKNHRRVVKIEKRKVQ